MPRDDGSRRAFEAGYNVNKLVRNESGEYVDAVAEHDWQMFSKGWKALHQEMCQPSDGLLASIAMRLDHSFGIQGSLEPNDHFENRQYHLLCDARRAVDEITGRGFYHPRKEQDYVSMITHNTLAYFKQYKGI